MASREPSSQAKGGGSSRRDKKKSPAKKAPARSRKGSAGRPSADNPPGKKTAPRPVAVGRRKEASVAPGRARRLLVLLVSLCTFLLALDLLVLWAPVTEHMDMSGYDHPARVTGSQAHLAVGVPATQKAWRKLWKEAGYEEREPGDVKKPRQFSMTPGHWQVHPDAGPLLQVSTRKRRVTRLIGADDQLPVAGWNFPMPPLAQPLVTRAAPPRPSWGKLGNPGGP